MPSPATPYEWDITGGESLVDDWDAVENSIHAQIVSGSGLATGKVIWDAQSRGRPVSDFIDLNITEIITFDPTTPEIVQTDTVDPGPGEELTLAAIEDIEIVVRIEYFSSIPSGSMSAYARMMALHAFFGRDDVTDALWENGVALTESGTVQRIPKVLEAEYESRAMFDARFRFKIGAEQFTTYIEHVNAQGTLDGTKLPVDFPVTIA